MDFGVGRFQVSYLINEAVVNVPLYKSSHGHLFFILSGKLLGVATLSSVVDVCFIL